MIPKGNLLPPSASPVRPERIETLVDAPIARGDYVLYWMQKAQRAAYNPALETAIFLAKELGQALVVLFVLCDYPGANSAQYRFMLEGLRETAREIRAHGAGFAFRAGRPAQIVSEAARFASVLVTDAPRNACERDWRREIAAMIGGIQDGHSGPATETASAPSPSAIRCPFFQVETEAVLPPFLVSDKEEWSARTIRSKLLSRLPEFLAESTLGDWHIAASGQSIARNLPGSSSGPSEEELLHSRDGAALPEYPGDRVAEQRIRCPSGHAAAIARLRTFLESDGLSRYDSLRGDPSKDAQSGLSPYLHFGQISPVEAALLVLDSEAGRISPGATAFLEQLIVRRELAVNFALFNPDCARYESAVPEWARKTLEAHTDERAERFSREELEAGATDDPCWNAAQHQMVLTGSMHNYMRMYWGKRLLAWRKNPTEAFDLLVGLNDRYSLDGRDPNGYAGLAWSIAGIHDMGWAERAVFGKIRYMNYDGCRRKFDVPGFERKYGSSSAVPKAFFSPKGSKDSQ